MSIAPEPDPIHAALSPNVIRTQTLVRALSVRSRVFCGFALMLVLLIATTWMTRQAVSAIEGRIANVRSAAGAALAAERISLSLTALRSQVAAYIGSERGIDLKMLRDEMESFEAALADSRKAGSAGDNSALAQQQQEAEDLKVAINRTIDLVHARKTSIDLLIRTGIGMTNGMSSLIERLPKVGLAEQFPAALRVQEALHAVLLSASRFVATRDPANADLARVELIRIAAALPGLSFALADFPKVQRSLASLQEKLPACSDAINQLLDNLLALATTLTQREQLGAQLAASIGAIRDGAVLAEQRNAAEASTFVREFRLESSWAAAIAVLVGLLATWTTGRSVTRPLERLVLTMRRLAGGDAAFVVQGCTIRNELGEMARAVEVFRQGAVERGVLQADRDAAGALAATERRRVVEAVALAFEEQVRGVVEAVAGRADDMQSASRSLAASAAATHSRMRAVVGRSGEASANVDAVAAAAESLAGSIAEVSRQIGRAAEVARFANKQTNQTDATLAGLTEAVAHIGSMTDLIGTIAGQTKMLALNATIEAAHAGDAGQGFAVVASEVKDLAQQTARAAEIISRQVKGIQMATASSVEAVGSMGQATAEVDLIAAAVAVAIAEQSAATTLITRNAQTAALGTREISATVLDVGDSASATGDAAEHMLDASRTLGSHADRLRDTASDFLAQIAAAA